ncbi:MAG: hypothetical protein R3C14_48560 [Caldilineaceae bacterium]
MYPSQFFNKRYGTLVLVLCYLVAMLLPAHRVVAADQEVTIPKTVVDEMAYQALWQQAYQGNDAVEALIYDMFILDAGKAGVNETDMANMMSAYMTAVDGQLHNAAVRATQGPTNDAPPSGQEVAQQMIETAITIPQLQPYIKDVWKSFARPLGFLPSLDEATKIGSSSSQFFNPQLGDLVGDVIKQLVDASQSNLAVSKGCDTVHQKKVKVSVKKIDGGTVLKQTPTLNLPPEIIQSIQLNGTINVTLNQLKDLSVTEFNNIELSLDDMRQTLVQIDAKQDVIIDYINNQQEREQMQALAEAKAAEHKLKLEAIQSSINVISTLAGFIDPKLGKDLNTVADSALQIGQSLDGWLDAVAGLSALDKIGSLSTVVMTGNVLGAVMNVVNLFGDSGPSPDQMILQEIGKLRQQVDQLRTEMHDRFDRVDQELNTLYTTMQDRFDKIDIQLGKLNANILEVQRTLLDLDLKLSRIERNNFELLDTVGRRPLLEAMNGGLGYQERTGHVMPFQPDFVNYENIFQTWGTIHAFDALATGPSQRDFSDGALLSELNALPLDANLNYLNEWLKLHGLPGIANGRLASPRDWLFASRAYSQLGVEWPDHMKQIDPQRAAALDAVGADLQTAMHNLSTLTTATGAQANRLLYTTVISNYENKLGVVDTSLQKLETSAVQATQTALQRSEPFDLYGGIDQVTTYRPAGLNALDYGDENGATLPLPSNVAALLPTFNRHILASYFKLADEGQFHVTLDGLLLHGKPQCPPPPNPQPDVCPSLGDLQVSVSIRYGTLSLAGLTMMAGKVLLPVINGDLQDPTSYVVDHWGNLGPRFETQAVEVPPTPAVAQQRADLLKQFTTSLKERLAHYQQDLYGSALTALTQGEFKAQAAELAGSKALLDSLVTVGLDRAVSDDDFFHAMLYGNQQLVTDNQIVQSYAISATQPITGTGLTVNPRLRVKQMADARDAAFKVMINHYLDAIGAQTHVEAVDYIAEPRRDLDLAMRIARLDQSAPVPGTNQLYLPLVER